MRLTIRDSIRSAVFITLCVCLSAAGRAATYYFSAGAGNDARTSAQAQHAATPWQSLRKLNAIFPALHPGDSILFKRGDVFDGALAITQSGALNHPIVLSAYGKGNRPVINGLTPLSSWARLGQNIWESATVLPAGYLNLLTINGVVQGKGRYPNPQAPHKGYLTYQAFTTTHSDTYTGDYSGTITDKTLRGTPGWAGAEVVVRKRYWMIDKGVITTHKDSVIAYYNKSSPEGPATAGFGYFIQNHPGTLDVQGEWYYHPATRKLRLFSTVPPAGLTVKAAGVDTLVSAYNKKFITFSNLVFQGGDTVNLSLQGCANIVLDRCVSSFSGGNGICADTAVVNNLVVYPAYTTVRHCNIRNCNNTGIFFAISSSDNVIEADTITACGLLPGMAGNNNQQRDGMFIGSNNTLINGNVVDSVGYCGIAFLGSGVTVSNNTVRNFLLNSDDGGGIYTYGAGSHTNRSITGNIIENGPGAAEGTNITTPFSFAAHGIYTDDKSSEVKIDNNIISNCRGGGIYLHNAHEIMVRGNTIYNCTAQLKFVNDAIAPGDSLRNLVVKNNVLIAQTRIQMVCVYSSLKDDLEKMGVFDSNYYSRPSDAGAVIAAQDKYYDLAGWKSLYSRYDVHSGSLPSAQPYTVNAATGSNLSLQSSAVFRGDQPYPQVHFSAFAANRQYLIRFTLQGAGKHYSVRAYLQQNWKALPQANYFILTDPMFFPVRPSPATYEFLYYSPRFEQQTMLVFEVAGLSYPITVSNVEVRQVKATLTDPAGIIRVVHNATQNNKLVPLTGTYKDVNNTFHKGSITLPPRSAAVLMKTK